MNSLWPTEQCRQGKSANQIRNFGKRIGSEGRVGRAATRSGRRAAAGLGEPPSRGGRARTCADALPADRRGCAGLATRLGRRRTADLELVRTRGIRLFN